MTTDTTPTDHELRAYLDEALPAGRMQAIESGLRRRPDWLARLALVISQRDSGGHTLAEIWRRNRTSCPSRAKLGSWLLGVLESEEAQFIDTHLNIVGCRWCQANRSDLESQPREAAPQASSRRRRFAQTSAGYLPRPGARP